jgi:purine-nucleoside phosphorylase
MSDLSLRLALTRNFLAKANKLRPRVAVVLGSGLGAVAQMVEAQTTVAYREIPNFPATTVAGHKGRLIFGMVGDVPVTVFDGRLHYYEGLTMEQVAYPAYVSRELGTEVLIATNAAGGISEALSPGDLMLVRDHLNLMGDTPLRGEQARPTDTRFVSMRDAYDPALLDLALGQAAASGIALKLGVYAALSGPSYETDAELRMLYGLGADAVGMSTVPEVIVARHCGMRVLALSVIANDAMPKRRRRLAELDHNAVLHEVEGAAPRVRTVLERTIAAL